MMLDTVIRGGTIVDGTGRAGFTGDLGIAHGRIVEVGGRLGPARREIDADGALVAPGWVDIHSHFDGQATWDPLLRPSGDHGVTTTVFGNCGVGFAPARPQDREALITLMEGVEDIPGTALSEGLPWNWESFPEYLDALAGMPRGMDVAALIPHSAVRAYVMGPEPSIRGIADDRQMSAMSEMVRNSIRAGAWGLSTSRTKLHLGADGKPVPGSFVEMEELLGLGSAVAAAGGGMLQLVCDWSADDPGREFAWMRRLCGETGLPLSFTLVQHHETPDHHYRLLELLGEARAAGLPIHAGVGSRPVGMLINLESKVHPFSHRPSYAAIAALDLPAKLVRLRDPALRARILAERPESLSRFWQAKMQMFDTMFVLGETLDYEPTADSSIAARAAREGRSPEDIIYDVMIAGDGSEWLYFPLINYAEKSLAPQLEMIRHPGAVLSLADGGAHCGLICDASGPTYQLSYWARDRSRGERLSVEEAVHLQTGRTAAFWGFHDRGEIAVGKRADLNIIDFKRLRLLKPYWAADLPAGGRRLLQKAEGYVGTFLAGEQTWAEGEPTGALPGGLVRAGAGHRAAA
jgi:N-acyl-D-aspartate/D-glutamate deacylase